ncbi:SDR family oxidoreductase [Flavobacterium sp.]|uniref:SDR family NAD(P)-dependent oxidoreductase n=1 Tax=Flavobacterium sp. TaxID=239 RepID=UPI0025C10920|nr:SDR family oxidoreductase [Flavobacterium sp.]
MAKLKDRTAFITGADSGIGQAIAIAFAREGAHVAVCYHSDREGAKETASVIEKLGQKALLIKLNVSKEKQVEDSLDKAEAEFGGIDILVNNAALNGSNIPLAKMEIEQFDTVIKTNLYSVFFSSRWFAKKARKGSKIINISSVHENIATAGNTDYNASKGAVRMFMRSLALEMAPLGITVNNIGPGMILTPMNQEALDNKSVRDEKSAHIPLLRPGQPEEIAKLAVFLASDDGNYVTGSTYFMDGGLMINQGQGA